MKKEKYIFRVGSNLADGKRYEKGDKVPVDISKTELNALLKMKAIEVKK